MSSADGDSGHEGCGAATYAAWASVDWNSDVSDARNCSLSASLAAR